MANIVDPDQTAHKEQSDLGLQCLPKRAVQIFGVNTTQFSFFTMNNREQKFEGLNFDYMYTGTDLVGRVVSYLDS